MNSSPTRVVVLWTGGKDSCLALFRVLEANLHVCALATFVPGPDATFQAHPLEMMQRQALELGLHHELVTVSPPYRPSYEAGLARIKARFQADAVVTGDIDEVAAFPNWIAQCAAAAGLETIRPLWRQPRLSLLREVVERKIQATISWINDPRLASLGVGRRLDDAWIQALESLAKTTDIDLCGENGEYHTMVCHLPRIAGLSASRSQCQTEVSPCSPPTVPAACGKTPACAPWCASTESTARP